MYGADTLVCDVLAAGRLVHVLSGLIDHRGSLLDGPEADGAGEVL